MGCFASNNPQRITGALAIRIEMTNAHCPSGAHTRKQLASVNKTRSELAGTGERDLTRASSTGWQRPSGRGHANASRPPTLVRPHLRRDNRRRGHCCGGRCHD